LAPVFSDGDLLAGCPTPGAGQNPASRQGEQREELYQGFQYHRRRLQNGEFVLKKLLVLKDEIFLRLVDH
jgi:hypothetical protein